jgi:DNA-binding transcriptional MocR family regulator
MIAGVNETEALDREVRLYIYRRFLDAGSPPGVSETAEALGAGQSEVEAAYQRLAEGRAIVLEPGKLDVWMAPPLSARPTAFRVDVAQRGRWWGTCAWDAPGIAAMLDADAVIFTSCADCEEPLTMGVERGRLGPPELVAHFAVPAANWWDDIGFT